MPAAKIAGKGQEPGVKKASRPSWGVPSLVADIRLTSGPAVITRRMAGFLYRGGENENENFGDDCPVLCRWFFAVSPGRG